MKKGQGHIRVVFSMYLFSTQTCILLYIPGL